ncbi:hypothetical protein [Chromobacterium phragmitis]|uniref:Uncharacterized protein n=1 Tax=Chromobacterium phragmitis TaxID=2202141 RepID=A0A344UPE7_9NEIS|nr:hypothetical protein [Chromobacterium phragmitis]AXE37145.1 hypothetical protein DK843_22605 [Chromobacterium phragmitis]
MGTKRTLSQLAELEREGLLQASATVVVVDGVLEIAFAGDSADMQTKALLAGGLSIASRDLLTAEPAAAAL